MKKILSCILVIVLLASLVPMSVMPAGAQSIVVPGDKEPYDKIISEDELASVILSYMLGTGHLGLDEVREIAHIHVYYPRTIVDDTVTDTYPKGKQITIYKPIRRIITLHSNSAEILKLLRSEDKIVGICKYTVDEKFFGDITKLPKFDMANPNAEGIISLNPDIVIAYGGHFTTWTKGLDDKLKGTAITLVRLDCYLPETMSEDIRKLGYILEREKEAEEFIDWYGGYRSIIGVE